MLTEPVQSVSYASLALTLATGTGLLYYFQRERERKLQGAPVCNLFRSFRSSHHIAASANPVSLPVQWHSVEQRQLVRQQSEGPFS